MKWKDQTSPEECVSVQGVNDIEIPQFTIMETNCISTIEKLATGRNYALYATRVEFP